MLGERSQGAAGKRFPDERRTLTCSLHETKYQVDRARHDRHKLDRDRASRLAYSQLCWHATVVYPVGSWLCPLGKKCDIELLSVYMHVCCFWNRSTTPPPQTRLASRSPFLQQLPSWRGGAAVLPDLPEFRPGALVSPLDPPTAASSAISLGYQASPLRDVGCCVDDSPACRPRAGRLASRRAEGSRAHGCRRRRRGGRRRAHRPAA